MKLLLIILLFLIYAKWIAIGLSYPWICLLFQFQKRKGLMRKVLAIPGYIIERLTNEGASRFIIINIGHLPSIIIRRIMYRLLGVSMGKNVIFHYKTEIRRPINLKIGNGSIIGDNAILDSRNGLTIGRNVNFSSNVSVYTEQHDHRDSLFRCNNDIDKRVEIGDRVWVGCNVIILPGVKIGEGAVCCAGCVVTKDIAPYDIVAGIPARKISSRSHNLQYEFDGTSCWFY